MDVKAVENIKPNRQLNHMLNRYTISPALLRISWIAFMLLAPLCGERALAQTRVVPRTLTVTNPVTGFTVRTTDGGVTWESVGSDQVNGRGKMQVDASGEVNVLHTRAWPNPTAGETTIHLLLGQPASVVVTVHDMQGKEMMRFDRGALNAGEQAVTFDTSSIPSGAYYYHVTSDGTHSGGGLLVVSH